MSNRQYRRGTGLATHRFSPESEVEVKLTGRSSGSFNTGGLPIADATVAYTQVRGLNLQQRELLRVYTGFPFKGFRRRKHTTQRHKGKIGLPFPACSCSC